MWPSVRAAGGGLGPCAQLSAWSLSLPSTQAASALSLQLQKPRDLIASENSSSQGTRVNFLSLPRTSYFQGVEGLLTPAEHTPSANLHT